MSRRRPRFTNEQRRTRLVRRHHLSRKTADVTAAAGDLVGLHSTDPASVFLAARARVAKFTPGHLESALYERRTLARVLGMRRTMFVLPTELAPVVHAACTRDLARRERHKTIRFIEEGGVAKDGARWLARTEAATLDLLGSLERATATDMRKEIPALRKKFRVGVGTKWESEIGMSTRVLFLLANEGKIVRTKPRGSWLSTQYEWALTQPWLGIDIDSLETTTARAELARLWLRSFGPGTRNDMKWWAGWTVATTAKALEDAGAVEVDLEGSTGYALDDDLDAPRPPRPRAALLPALDSTAMGWFERDWHLGPHRDQLFDRSGNAGPTVWWDGRVVGAWSQRPSGEVVYRLLEDIGSPAQAEVEKEAAALQDWLGEVRIIPRFRTPVERDLSA